MAEPLDLDALEPYLETRLEHELIAELRATRAAYREKALELARLREQIGAAMHPESYNRAQREGNYT